MRQSSPMHAVGSVAKALALFLAVFTASTTSASLTALLLNAKPWVAGLVAQLSFLALSIAAMRLIGGGFEDYGFRVDTSSLAKVSLTSIACSAVLVHAVSIASQGEKSPLELPRDPVLLCLLLLLVAPVCEEVFLRGLVQGFLLRRGHFKLSIVVPALLFSAMHALPFSPVGPALLLALLSSALALGIIAGYFRAVSGSLLPAFLAHFWFNLVGLAAAHY